MQYIRFLLNGCHRNSCSNNKKFSIRRDLFTCMVWMWDVSIPVTKGKIHINSHALFSSMHRTIALHASYFRVTLLNVSKYLTKFLMLSFFRMSSCTAFLLIQFFTRSHKIFFYVNALIIVILNFSL